MNPTLNILGQSMNVQSPEVQAPKLLETHDAVMSTTSEQNMTFNLNFLTTQNLVQDTTHRILNKDSTNFMTLPTRTFQHT